MGPPQLVELLDATPEVAWAPWWLSPTGWLNHRVVVGVGSDARATI
jgi:hypothetical protein